MKAKENVKNDEINLQADILADLPVTDEQAEEIGGGAVGGHVKVFSGATLEQSGAELDIIVGAGPGGGPHIK